MADHYDCLIVGGGPAGLTAAIYLARFRRAVLVLDGAESRAALIPSSHNYPGFASGISGAELIGALAAQAERYGAHLQRAAVDELAREDDRFSARADGLSVRAKRVLLATGIVDETPALPHIKQFVYSGAVRYCPICDGYEALDRRIAVVGPLEHAMKKALFLRTYSRKVAVLPLDSQFEANEALRRWLVEAGIGLPDAPLQDLATEGDAIRAVMADGVEFEIDVLYPAMGAHARSHLARKLGVRCADQGNVMCDDHQRTSVPHLYAAGDVTTELHQISVAVGQAAIAATDIHNGLERNFR